MNVEFTGRHFEVPPAIRKEVETRLTKIRKILGDKFETKVILSVEKRRHKAEITITPRNGPLVSEAQAGDMPSAVNEAFEHLEKQAVKYKTRWRTQKRHNHKSASPKKWNGSENQEALVTAVGLSEASTGTWFATVRSKLVVFVRSAFVSATLLAPWPDSQEALIW